MPDALAAAALLGALRHLEADSLVAECRDSASEGSALPALIAALLHGTFSVAARRMTARSGVGRARRAGHWGAGAAAGGELGGDGGREGRRGRAAEASGGLGFTTAASTTRKVFVSQDSFTYSASLLPEGGNGAAASRCFTCHRPGA